ncbi:MAG: LPS assembly lipoprotein LptE [Marinilabiliales bacterium]|nr:LPS assembly lipoprotein LptE [Marinilabiliales bacterium]
MAHTPNPSTGEKTGVVQAGKSLIRRATVTFLILLAATTSILSGCKISYSMSGASISPDVKTVMVEYFRNRSKVINPTLSQVFTEAMKDKFVNETGLSLRNDQGDLEFSGEITGYDVRPLSVQKSDTGRDFASMNRLTITVKVIFVNNKDHDWDFNTTFSAYFDWDSSKTISQVETEANRVIVEQLVEDIFNKSVANW